MNLTHIYIYIYTSHIYIYIINMYIQNIVNTCQNSPYWFLSHSPFLGHSDSARPFSTAIEVFPMWNRWAISWDQLMGIWYEGMFLSFMSGRYILMCFGKFWYGDIISFSLISKSILYGMQDDVRTRNISISPTFSLFTFMSMNSAARTMAQPSAAMQGTSDGEDRASLLCKKLAACQAQLRNLRLEEVDGLSGLARLM